MRQHPGIKKIAVLRALQLGDMLCAIPAMRALRHASPHAEITLLGLPWAASFTERFHHYFDRFIWFPGYPGLPEQEYDEAAFSLFMKEVQREEFDLILQMQGNGTIVNPLVMQMGARYVAGFHNAQSHVPSSLFMAYPNTGSEVSRHLLLMNYLGMESQGEELEFPLTEQDHHELEELLLPVMPKSYVVIHPGSRGSWRQWPPAYFAMMADHCNSHGYIAIITGTEAERDITREVRKCLRSPAIDLTGKTSLGAMAVLLKDAFLLISNCTGVAHIAAAVQTPGLIISMDGEPDRWGHPIHEVIDWTTEPHLDIAVLKLADLMEKQKEALKVEHV